MFVAPATKLAVLTHPFTLILHSCALYCLFLGVRFVKEVMERDEPLTPKKDQVKEENPWTEGDGGGCTIV